MLRTAVVVRVRRIVARYLDVGAEKQFAEDGDGIGDVDSPVGVGVRPSKGRVDSGRATRRVGGVRSGLDLDPIQRAVVVAIGRKPELRCRAVYR